MKRRVLLLPLLLTLLFATAACGGGEPTPIPVTPVAITYMSFDQSNQILAEELVIERFQERYPAIQITRTSYGQQPQDYLLGTSTRPDVMLLWTGYLLDTAMRQAASAGRRPAAGDSKRGVCGAVTRWGGACRGMLDIKK